MALVDGIHKGDLYALRLDDGTQALVGCLTSLAVDTTMDTTEVPACRSAADETGGWKKYIPGDKSMEITAEGQVLMAENWNPERFLGVMDSETEMDFVMEPVGAAPTYTPIPNGLRITGKCWLTSFSMSMPNDEVTTYSATLIVNGRPNVTQIP